MTFRSYLKILCSTYLETIPININQKLCTTTSVYESLFTNQQTLSVKRNIQQFKHSPHEKKQLASKIKILDTHYHEWLKDQIKIGQSQKVQNNRCDLLQSSKKSSCFNNVCQAVPQKRHFVQYTKRATPTQSKTQWFGSIQQKNLSIFKIFKKKLAFRQTTKEECEECVDFVPTEDKCPELKKLKPMYDYTKLEKDFSDTECKKNDICAERSDEVVKKSVQRKKLPKLPKSDCPECVEWIPEKDITPKLKHLKPAYEASDLEWKHEQCKTTTICATRMDETLGLKVTKSQLPNLPKSNCPECIDWIPKNDITPKLKRLKPAYEPSDMKWKHKNCETNTICAPRLDESLGLKVKRSNLPKLPINDCPECVEWFPEKDVTPELKCLTPTYDSFKLKWKHKHCETNTICATRMDDSLQFKVERKQLPELPISDCPECIEWYPENDITPKLKRLKPAYDSLDMKYKHTGCETNTICALRMDETLGLKIQRKYLPNLSKSDCPDCVEWTPGIDITPKLKRLKPSYDPSKMKWKHSNCAINTICAPRIDETLRLKVVRTSLPKLPINDCPECIEWVPGNDITPKLERLKPAYNQSHMKWKHNNCQTDTICAPRMDNALKWQPRAKELPTFLNKGNIGRSLKRHYNTYCGSITKRSVSSKSAKNPTNKELGKEPLPKMKLPGCRPAVCSTEPPKAKRKQVAPYPSFSECHFDVPLMDPTECEVSKVLQPCHQSSVTIELQQPPPPSFALVSPIREKEKVTPSRNPISQNQQIANNDVVDQHDDYKGYLIPAKYDENDCVDMCNSIINRNQKKNAHEKATGNSVNDIEKYSFEDCIALCRRMLKKNKTNKNAVDKPKDSESDLIPNEPTLVTNTKQNENDELNSHSTDSLQSCGSKGKGNKKIINSTRNIKRQYRQVKKKAKMRRESSTSDPNKNNSNRESAKKTIPEEQNKNTSTKVPDTAHMNTISESKSPINQNTSNQPFPLTKLGKIPCTVSTTCKTKSGMVVVILELDENCNEIPQCENLGKKGQVCGNMGYSNNPCMCLPKENASNTCVVCLPADCNQMTKQKKSTSIWAKICSYFQAKPNR